MWTVEVFYEQDGTAFHTMHGHRISSQIFGDGRAMIRTYDEAGELTEVLQVARVWSVRRFRA